VRGSRARIAWLVASVLLCAAAVATVVVFVLREPVQPKVASEGPVFFRTRGTRVELTASQARAFRAVLAAPGVYVDHANHRYASEFFELDGRTYYSQGRALRVEPEQGAHWEWLGNPALDRFEAASRAGFDSVESVRRALGALEEVSGGPR